jgi:hypothetical protein
MVKFQRSLEIQVYQLFLAPLKITMLELLYVIWELELGGVCLGFSELSTKISR